MKVVDSGRRYELAAGNALFFLQKDEGAILHDGTTNEEVLEVLIDRVTEAYQALPCQESIRALYLLREALAAFRLRSARRVNAQVEGTRRAHGMALETADMLPDGATPGDFQEMDLAPN